MFEPTCNTTPKTEGGTSPLSSRHPSFHRTLSASPHCHRVKKNTVAVCLPASLPVDRRYYFEWQREKTLPKMSATELRSLTEPQSLSVMPSWTTGGTDVICERETDKAGDRERDRERERDTQKKREWGRQGKGERGREGGRGREMQ